MYHVYVLKSDAFDRIYIGTTADVDTRVRQHNQGKTPSTSPYCPWRLIYIETYADKKSTLRRERQMKKSGVIRRALKQEIYTGPIV